MNCDRQGVVLSHRNAPSGRTPPHPPRMLSFSSASVRVAHTRRAVEECLAAVAPASLADCRVLMVHATMGHDFRELAGTAARLAPHACIVGASCSAVTGREGGGESLKDIAAMAISGEGVDAVHAEGLDPHNCVDRIASMASELLARLPGLHLVYLMLPGVTGPPQDLCLHAISGILGPEVKVFGACSSDNLHAGRSYQVFGRGVHVGSAWMVGFADPSLEVITGLSHGFVPFGEPLVVSRAEGNRILELNGSPAWSEYTRLLGLPEHADRRDTIPIGALAEHADHPAGRFPPLLRMVGCRDPDGALRYSTTIREGTRLWLTLRDEDQVAADLARMTAEIGNRAAGRTPVAVFQTDCTARGRHLFNKSARARLLVGMQSAFAGEGGTPPWLGIYGLGQFVPVGGRNECHNYASGLCALYRRPGQGHAGGSDKA